MELPVLLAILATIALGTYFQTVTGFGLGIIVIGLTVSLNLVSINVIAAVVSIVTLFNCLVALMGKPLLGELKILVVLVLGIIPGVSLGVFLLGELSESATHILRALLGAMVLFAGLSFMFKPKTRTERSATLSFFVSGFSSGLAGGAVWDGGSTDCLSSLQATFYARFSTKHTADGVRLHVDVTYRECLRCRRYGSEHIVAICDCYSFGGACHHVCAALSATLV